MRSLIRYIIFLVFLIWAGIFMTLFQLNFPTYLLEILPELFYFLIITVSCYGLGEVLLKALKLEILFLEKFIFSMAMGLIIFSAFATAAGFLGWLNRGLFLSFLFLTFFLSIPSLLRALKEFKEKFRNFKLTINFEFLCSILLIVQLL